MKTETKKITLDKLILGENPRLPNNYHTESLADNIQGIGLLEPISATPNKDGSYLVIRGHRRVTAIKLIQARDSKRFEELFAKGINTVVYTDISPEEVITLKLDHSDQQPLQHSYELLHSASMLFAIGKSEADVSFQLAGLIDKISPMKADSKRKVEELKEKMRTASNNDAKIIAESELRKYIADYRRGYTQHLHNICRCPVVVMSALYKDATGQAPADCKEYLPKLTTDTVKKLWKAHSEDLKVLENGVPVYNRERTGANFRKLWQEICEKEQNKTEKPKEERQRAMTAEQMAEDAKNNGYKSELAHRLTARHAGDMTASVTLLDEASYYADLLRKFDASAWSEVVKIAKEISQRLIEQDKKAEAVKANEPAVTVKQ